MSNKIDLDKYYTPIETAKYCIDKVYDIISDKNISEVIEPSAGRVLLVYKYLLIVNLMILNQSMKVLRNKTTWN